MRIGVDIDGVLNYNHEIMLIYGSKYCVERGLPGIQDADAHGIQEIFGMTEEEKKDLWRKVAKYQMWVCPARDFAAEVIRKLREEGHEIFIVTGRNNDDVAVEGMPNGWSWEEITKDWLKRNEIQYDRIEFNRGMPAPNDKGTFCEEQGIDVMIEDLPVYLETLAGKTRVLVFDRSYNRAVNLPEMQRVYSWYDVYGKIREMEG